MGRWAMPAPQPKPCQWRRLGLPAPSASGTPARLSGPAASWAPRHAQRGVAKVVLWLLASVALWRCGPDSVAARCALCPGRCQGETERSPQQGGMGRAGQIPVLLLWATVKRVHQGCAIPGKGACVRARMLGTGAARSSTPCSSARRACAGAAAPGILYRVCLPTPPRAHPHRPGLL